MSERSEVAARIAAFIAENGLAQIYGGDVHQDDSRKFYSVGFSLAATLDGSVQVYSPKFIRITSAGPHGQEPEVFDSEENAIAFLRARWIDFDHDAALAIRRKPAKPRTNE